MSNPFLYRLNGLSKLEDVLQGGKFRHDVLKKFHLGHLCSELVNENDANVSVPEHKGERFVLIVPKVPPNGNTASHTDFDPESDPEKCTQRWYKHPDGTVEIGWVVNEPPVPEVLERRRGGQGLITADASQRKWIVPVGRSNHGRETFKKDYVFDLANDDIQTTRSRSSDHLFDIATEIWELYTNDESDENGKMTADQKHRLFKLVVDALAINYCISPLEVNALSAMGMPIFDTSNIDLFAFAVTDWSVWDEFQKKSQNHENQEAQEAGDISS